MPEFLPSAAMPTLEAGWRYSQQRMIIPLARIDLHANRGVLRIFLRDHIGIVESAGKSGNWNIVFHTKRAVHSGT